MLHGTVDTNVPIGESIQLYNALKILGKPVEFITVDGENHFVLDYAKRELWHNSIMAWFARWLQDSPAWWNDLYPEDIGDFLVDNCQLSIKKPFPRIDKEETAFLL